MVRNADTLRVFNICRNLFSLTRATVVSRIAFIVLIGLLSSQTAKADHFWYVNSLTLVEDPANSGMYRIDYTFTVNFQTVKRFYWEVFVVESGCNATDGFTESFSGCTLQGDLADGDYTGTLASGILLCPGKTYDAIMFTRRRGDCLSDNTGGSGGANTPNCGAGCGDTSCGCPEDRASAATPLGLLTKFPAVNGGDPANIWAGTPLNTLGDTPTYDGNWAYIRTTLSGTGVPDYDFGVDITLDDCFGDFNQSAAFDETDGQVVTENFGGITAQIRCGTPLNVEYNAVNSCGAGFPGNTFEVIDNSTIGGVSIGSNNSNIPMGPDVNVDGRFEELTGQIAIGNVCQSGQINLNMINATCSAESETDVTVIYDLEVLYPTSNFATPTRVNCSDACGQDLILSGGPQWNSTGLNMGTSTTLPVTDDDTDILNFDWTGQICTPSVSATDCDEGAGTVTVDNCASCGVYDITYEISNDECPTCNTTTTKQIEIVSPVITNESADITECNAITPAITFDVVECNPSSGAATSVAYTGSGEKMWERSDNPGVMIPFDSPGIVAAGETVTFTPHWVFEGCASCNAEGTPITVTSLGQLVVTCPAITDLGDFDCSDLATIPALPTTQAAAASAPYNLVIGSDPCGTIVVSASDDATPDACTAVTQVITRTVTILDDQNGNGVKDGTEAEMSCIYTYDILSAFVPPAVVGQPGDESITCDTPPATTTLNFTNNGVNDCLSAGTVTSTLTAYPGICGGAMTETWTIPSADNCNNGDIVTSRTITILPPDPPIVTCPANTTVACADDIVIGTPTVMTSCGATFMTATSGPTLISGDPDCPGAIYHVVYTVTDQCSNVVSCTQVFSIANAAPTVTAPDDATVECLSDIEVGTPMTTTSCSLGESVTTVGPTLTSGMDNCHGATYTIVYTVEDACGRAASATQTFTLSNTGPTITCPADGTVTCFADISIGTPTVVTKCGLGSTITTSGPTLASGTADCPGATYEILYTVTDACGRMATCTQTFTIANPAPTITPPADISVECFSDIAAGVPTSTTSCTLGSTITNSAPVLANGVADCDGATYEITYTIVDACGRMAEAIQTFTLSNTPPIIIPPSDAIVECLDDISVGAPTTSTSCTLGETVTTLGPTLVSGIADCPGASYSIVYTVTDDCGRSVSATQFFTLANDPPTITCPANAVVECADDIVIGTPTVMTSCALGFTVTTLGPTLMSGDEDCDGSIYAVVYTATDVCGRAVSCTQTFTISNTAPTIETLAPMTVSCLADIAAGTPTASASCDLGLTTVTTVGPTLTSGMNECDGATYEIIYSVMDDCGRSASSTQVFTLDNNGPTITMCPTAQTVVCRADIMANIAGVVYTTDCGVTATVTAGPIVPNASNSACGELDNDSYSITYTVEDICGRQTTCVQVFSINSSDPNITCADDILVVGCDASAAPAPDPSLIFGSDGCGMVTVTFVSDSPAGNVCDTLVISRTYRVTNACGLASDCIQLIKIYDDIAPSITTDAGTLTVGCNEEPPVPNVTVMDNCTASADITIDFREDTLAMTCPGDLMIIRTWIATDQCGNQDSIKQEIGVFDESNPTFLSAPSDTTISCVDVVPISMDPVFDASCGLSEVVMTEATTPGTCPGQMIIMRTWAAEDSCMRMISFTQTITVSDTVKPTIVCPADVIIVGCGLAALPPATPSAIIASDGCSMVTVTHEGDTQLGGGCIGDTLVVSRRYRATDECGNFTECIQRIRIVDNIAPVITSCPADIVVIGCSAADAPAVDPTLLTASDNCTTTPILTHVSDTPSGTVCIGDTLVITRIYRATDDCGNFTDCTQIIKIVDNVDPVITSCPTDIIVKCFADIPAPMPEAVVATDNCGVANPATTLSIVDNGGSGCPGDAYTITYTYQVADACNNLTTCAQVITVIDDNDPVISAGPVDETIQCIEELPDPDPSAIVATDNCGIEAVTVIDTMNTSAVDCSVNPFQVIYTYRVVDSCGNSDTYMQTFTVNDVTPPVLSATPGMITVSCLSDVPGAQGITATDNCTGVMAVMFTQSAAGACPGSDIITNTWTVTDCVGNRTTHEQLVIIDDNIAPVFDVEPTDTTVTCFSDVPGDPGVMATDNCGEGLTVTFTQSAAGVCPGNDTITNTWTTEDCAGNVKTHIQTITIDDNTSPVLSALPANMTVACRSQVPGDPGITATDNCGEAVTVIYAQSAPGACIGDDIITNTWTVSDCAGNMTSHVQTITVDDNILPILSAQPADITVQCFSLVPGNPNVTATDNCGEVLVVNYVQSAAPSCAGTGSVTNTWTVSDCAGNLTSHTQTVTIMDVTPPVFNAMPVDAIVSCTDDVPGDPGVTATDNCGESLMVTYIQSAAPSCAGSGTITNTWTVTDCAGLMSMHTQTVTIVDNIKPTLSELPSDTIVTCSANVPGDPGVTATDNCGEVLSVTYIQSAIGTCPGDDTITNTWTVTDCAGNVTTHIQNVIVDDNTKPILNSMPADLTVQCFAAVPGDPGVTATDNCGENLSVTFAQSTAGACPGDDTITNTWTVTDCAGNVTTHIQTITIDDTTAPILSAMPMNTIVECFSEVPGAQGITATDNCGEAITVVYTQSLQGACVGVGMITNTWTATDCDGNVTTHNQVVTLDDTTPPVFSATPADITVQCFNDVPGDPGVTATDNCGELLTVMFEQSANGSCEGNDEVTNTWTVMDCAGNPSTYIQTITIIDTTDPTAPGDEGSTVTCLSEAIEPGAPIAIIDNCGASIVPVGPVEGPDPPCAGSGTKSYTWTYTDCAGNSDIYTYTYTIVDETSPVLDVTPADTIINCQDAIPDAPSVNGIDACQGILPAQMTEVIEGNMDACPFDYTITRTWTVSDCAGNPVSHAQVITIQDVEDPVITCPADVIIIGCNRSFAPSVDITSVVATDNCGTPTITHIGDSFTGSACIGDTLVIERTYRATDICGHFTDCVQIIKIVDDVPPVVTGVSDLVVDCNADVDGLFANWIANNGGGTAIDNCDIFSWSTIPASPVVTSMAGETCVTFVATDKCGNMTATEACFNINCSSIEKTFVANLDMDGSGDPSVGDSLLYSIVYTNEGSTELTNVVVSDNLITPSSKSCTTLASGASCVLTGYHVVTTDDVFAGSIVNVASGISDQTTLITDDVTLPVPTPSIAIQKNMPTLLNDFDNSGDMSIGDQLQYIVTATNNGTATLTDVIISDLLLKPSFDTCLILRPMENCSLVGTYIITTDDLLNGFVDNEASVDSDQTDPVDDDVIVELPSPLIEIVKGQPVNGDQDGSGDISLGDVLTYTITVYNTGDAALTNVTITDNTITKVGGSEPCAIVQPMETCTFIGEYLIQASDVSGTTINEITNIATADSDQTGQVVDSTTIMIPNPSLEINKFPAVLTGDNDSSQDVSLNDELTHTIVLTNNGNANLTNVQINDPTLTPSIKDCGTLMMGESCQLVGTHIVLPADLAAGIYENTVTGTSQVPFIEVFDTSTVVIPQPSHIITKSTPVIIEDNDRSTDPSAGDILGYTITVTNNGTANLTDIVIQDNLITPSSINCDLVEPGEVCVLTGTYEVQVSDLGTTLKNKAISNTDQTDMIMDTADVVVPMPMIDLEKTEGMLFADLDGNGLRSAGDTLLYIITATNTGTANLTNVTITDELIVPDTRVCEFLAPSDICQLVGKYVIDQGDMDVGQLVNTASVAAEQPSIDDKTVTTILPFIPELEIDKSVASISTANGATTDLIDPGDIITYNYLVTNTGLVTMRNISVNDAGPSFGGLPGTNSLSAITCDELTLLPGEVSNCSATYVISQVDFDNALGQDNGIFNIANTTGVDPRGETYTSMNDVAQDSIPDVPLVEIIKTAGDIADINGDGILWVDDEVIYTFVITNTGNSRLENLVVTDNNITNPIVCSGTALDPGESFTCTASYILTEADGEAGQVVNTASVIGMSPTGKIASDISDDPTDPTTSTSDPTIVVIPCPSISCRAEINLALDANDPFEVTPATVGLPSGFRLELTDENGRVIEDNIIDCSFAGKDITYSIFHPCRTSPCWGTLNIETKGLPEISSSYEVVICGTNYSNLISESDLIDSIHADGCYAPLTEVNSRFESEGDICDSITTIRSIFANATLDGTKLEVELRRDTIIEKPIGLDDVICPDSDEFANSLNIVCRQFNKFDNDLSPDNVFAMTRQVNKAYPYLDTGEEEVFFDTTIIKTPNNRIVTDTTIMIDGYHVVTDVVVHDTIFSERIVRGSRRVLIPITSDGLCNLSVKYDDVVFDGCLGPETKTVRTWTILNWCTGEIKTCVQWIIIIDDTPPTLEEPIDDVAISIEPWSCTANYILPDPIGPADDCTTLDYRWLSDKGIIEDGVITNLTIHDSPALFILELEDNCGNIRHDSSYLYIVDGSAPVAIAVDELNVTLTKDPVSLEGVAKIYVDDINQESHDAGCGDVLACVLKDEELSNPIIRDGVHLTNEDGALMYVPAQCSVDGIYIYESRGDKETLFEEIPYVICKEFVKFCCSDLGEQRVALVVSDGSPYSQDGISWTIVTVEDKSQGVIECEDVTVQCGEDYSPEVIGYPTVYDPVCGIGALTYVDEGNVSNCGSGTLIRTWLYDGVAACVQRISVVSEATFDPYTIKWPKHYTSETVDGIRRECELWLDEKGEPVIIDNIEQYRIVEYEDDVKMGDSFICTSEEDLGSPTWCAESCELIVANFETIELEASDACKKIIRRWTVVDWCTWDENSANVDDDNDTGLDEFQAIDDEWLDEDDPEKAGLWYTSYEEKLEPAVFNYPDGGHITKLECEHCEKSINPADHVYFRYINVDEDGYYTFDQVIKVIDNTEPVIEVDNNVVVEILGGAGSKDEGYENCNGITEVTAIASDFCNNELLSDDRLTWTVYVLDQAGQTIEGPISGFGDSMTVSTGYSSPGDDRFIAWAVTDGCNNGATTTTSITFKDVKQPTPICIEELSTATMNSNGTAVIWANDYDRGSFDNCGPVEIKFRDEDGAYTSALDIRCSDLANGSSQTFTLELYVIDEAGNFDFCNVTLRVDDNSDICPDQNTGAVATISGSIYTPEGDMIEGVDVSDGLAASMQTGSDGLYAFANLPMYQDYKISGTKNDDLNSGLTSSDLVLIQQHILGQRKLTTAYQVIAADVNNDQRVSALDLIELRRVILGVSDEFRNNESWRFIDANQTFDNPLKPWPLQEVVDINFLSEDMRDQHLVGVKIGDVNGTAVANSTLAGNRSKDLTVLRTDDQYFENGDLVVVSFEKSKELDIASLQFTLEVEHLELQSVTSDIGISLDDVGMHENDALTVVAFDLDQVEDDMIFDMLFRATSTSSIGESLRLNSSITTAKVYDQELKGYDLALEVEGGNAVTDKAYLLQNEPNPFKNETSVGFYLPKSGSIDLSFYDASGRLLHHINDHFAQGANQVMIAKKDLQVSGVVYYNLIFGDVHLQKRMIIID